MPIDKYFKGSGSKVMGHMQDEYGSKKGKSVFYATANARKMKPKEGGGLQPDDSDSVPRPVHSAGGGSGPGSSKSKFRFPSRG